MIETDFCGISLRNPLILASGVLGTNRGILEKVFNSGAGAVTTKSLGPQKNEGHENPTVTGYGDGIMNAVGLSCPSPEEALSEFTGIEFPLIVSIYGKKPEDYSTLIKKFAPLGSAYELNFSCPNVSGKMIATDPGLTQKTVKAAKKETGKPILAKLTPNVQDISEIAKAAEKGGADAITAINTLGPGMVIDLKTRKPILSNKKGGLSGPPIKPIAVRCVYDIFSSVKIPIIGVGGVSTPEDAIEMILAGATCVGVGSALAYQDLPTFGNISKGIEAYLKNNSTSLGEIRGAAHEKD